MLLKIACSCCGHSGVVSADVLPRELRCWQCGASRRVEPENSARIVSSAVRDEWVSSFLAAAR